MYQNTYFIILGKKHIYILRIKIFDTLYACIRPNIHYIAKSIGSPPFNKHVWLL